MSKHSSTSAPATSPVFPDRLHVEALRQALWRGRAAVMIGAGFSRNAAPVVSDLGPLPTWRDIIEALWEALGRGRPLKFGDDSLRIAEEFQQIRGRTELDNLIERLTPDEKYAPGILHKELLALPWRDVFTTNYDRLLERTCVLVPERPYELVLTHDDLSIKQSPRIVKLHGSFPSHRPYVFTLEDYRKYPRANSPFVNLVQEAIIENVFCLIGFSGDDPNFLQWSGWVRDHLGKAAPPIYLCGILDLGPSQQRFFQSIGITPIDLGPLFPSDVCSAGERHTRATEWLIRSLHNGKPIERICWPNKARLIDRGRLSFDSPAPLEAANIRSNSDSPDVHRKPTLENIRELTASWRSQRLTYPDWVVLPEENRAKIRHDIESWLFDPHMFDKLTKHLHDMDGIEKLETVYEFIWRLRACLMTLPSC